MTRRPWPPYLGPGWIVAYTAGLATWALIYELWGALEVIGLITVGVLMIAGAGHSLGARDDKPFTYKD
jgi:hypothetical protein